MARSAASLAAPLLTLALCGCAAGVARIDADGACEVRGVALGRASIAAYAPGAALEHEQGENTQRELEQDPCARLTGGQSSSTTADLLSGAVGALFGFLAAP